MCCPHCRLSWNTLRHMKENHIEFRTAEDNKPLWIFELDENKKTIKFERSTGKITNQGLKYQTLKEIHEQVHAGEIILDKHVIDEKVQRWGNYITGLLKHLGCSEL